MKELWIKKNLYMFDFTKIFVCLFLVSFVTQASDQLGILNNVSFYTEEYPPYNFSEGNEVKGIAVDLLVEAGKKMNSPFEIETINMVPWARAYRTVLERPNTVLLSAARTTFREMLFRWVGPIASTRLVVLSKKEAGIRLESIEQLKGYSIGVVIDDVGAQIIAEQGVPEQNIETANTALALAQMLEYGRIDLWVYEERVALWAIYEAGFQPEDYHVSFVLDEIDLYFALNRSTPELVVNALQTALNELRRKDKNLTSVHEEIMNRYKNWEDY